MNKHLRVVAIGFGLLFGLPMSVQVKAHQHTSDCRHQHGRLEEAQAKVNRPGEGRLQAPKREKRRREEPATAGKGIVATGVGAVTGGLCYGAAKELVKKAIVAKGGAALVVPAGIGLVVYSYLKTHREAAVTKLLGEKYVELSTLAAVGTFAGLYFSYGI